MDILAIDINQIVELGTRVAQSGAIRAGEMMADEIFDYVIGIAILIHEMHPQR